jgi:NADH:ubiquinone oxidoreductase subunit 6 (subunit J)
MPVNYRGLLFDLAVFACNVFLVRLLTRYVGRLLSLTFLRDDPQAARTLLIIISAAFAAQLVGASLKRRPLQARLLARHDGGGGSGIGCVIILHFALTLVTSAGIVALLPSEPSGGVTVLVFFLSLIPTALVWRATTPYKKPPEPDWRDSRGAEAVADLCLFAYMLVNLAVWNTVTAGSNVRAAGVGDVLSRALGFILVSPVILLFYLPPRLLFLVEDYKYPATWVSMTLAVAPVAYRLIIGSPLKTDW